MAEVGRPSTYSKKLANEICTGIALGNSLRTVLREESMPAMSTVMRWLADDRKKYFREQYARACRERAEVMAEDILDIADDGTNDWMETTRKDGTTYEVFNKEAAQRSKIRVDTRKWLMAKTLPKKYGDRINLDSEETVIHKYEDMTDEQLDAAIKARKDRDT